jgi:hypothetical protein
MLIGVLQWRAVRTLRTQEKTMPKYGRGLNREIVAAVNNGYISEPFSVKQVRWLIKEKVWHPEQTEQYIVVTLVNGANDNHSPTYKKYFFSIGDGLYKVRSQY